MDELIQHGKNTLWKVLFRKNSYADLYRKDNRGKKVSTTKIRNDKTEWE